MTLSYAFVGQPETNGVIERLFRTFKEQVVYGRIFQTIDEVRDAKTLVGLLRLERELRPPAEPAGPPLAM